jgi:hypothetical protein
LALVRKLGGADMNEYLKNAIFLVGGFALSLMCSKLEVAPQPTEHHERLGILGRLRRDSGDFEAGPVSIRTIRATENKAMMLVTTDTHEWFLNVTPVSAVISPLDSPIMPRPRIGDAP